LEWSGSPSFGRTLIGSGRVALAALGADRLRSALTLACLTLGVAALLLVVTLGEVTQDYVTSQWSHVGANLVAVSFKIGPGVSKADAIAHSPLTVDDARSLQDLPHVSVVSPLVYDGSSVAAGSYNGSWPIEAAFPAAKDLQNITMQSGTFFTDQDEAAGSPVAVVGADVVDHIFNGQNPVGQELRLGSVNFQVIGSISRDGAPPESNDIQDTIIVPISTYQQRLAGHNPTLIMLQADQTANIPAVITAVSQTLDQQHHIAYDQPSDFDVSYDNASTDPAVQQLDLARLVSTIVAAIALLVGGFAVASTMLVAVRQRTGEIGLRMAVGAAPHVVLQQFLSEAVILSIVGGVGGVVVGSALVVAFYLGFRNQSLGHWFRAAVQNHPLPSPTSIVVAVAVAVLIGAISGYLPARRAAQLDPIAALRDD
jgi:putative ABC transport system permease protein